MHIKSLFKRLIIFLSTAIILLIGLFIVWLNLIFDPEDYRENLIEWVETRTGHQVFVKGKIHADINLINSKPFLKLSIQNASIAENDQSDADPLFSVSLVEIEFQLIDLLKVKVRPKLQLVNPNLKIERADSTKTNWDLMVRNLWNDGLGNSEIKLIKGFTGLVISGVSIKNGNVIWSRTDTDNHLEIIGLDIENNVSKNLNSISMGAEFKCRGSFCRSHHFGEAELNIDLIYEQKLILTENINFIMSDDDDLITAHVKKIEFDMEKSWIEITRGKIAGVVKNEEFVFELDQGLYLEETDDLSFAEIYGRWVNPNIDSSINLTEATFNSVSTQLVPDIARLLSISQPDLFKEILTIVNYSFRASGDIKFSANNWENTIINGVLKNNRSNRVEAIIKVNTGVYGLEIENFTLDWAKSKFHGSLIPTHPENYTLTFEVLEDALDLSRMSLSIADINNYPGIGLLVFILNHFPDLELIGDIKASHVRWNKVQANRVEIPLRKINDHWRINDAYFEIYGGSADVSVEANQSMRDIVINFDQTYSNINIGDFLRSISVSENVKAIGDVQAKFIVKDSIIPNSVNSIKGKIIVNIPEGAILNLDKYLEKSRQLVQLREQLILLFGLQLDLEPLFNKVKFSNLTATIVMSDGQLFSDDISFDALGWQLISRSSYNVADDWYDAIWYVSPNRLNRILKGKGGEELPNIIFPFRVSGKSSSIEIELDLPELFRAL